MYKSSIANRAQMLAARCLACMLVLALIAGMLPVQKQAEAATSLSPGDIAVIGVNDMDASPNQRWAFVALASISSGTVIHFTDAAFDASISASSNQLVKFLNDDHMSWTVPSNILAGTLFVVTNNSVTGGTATIRDKDGNSYSGVTGTVGDFTYYGDQIIVYQGTRGTSVGATFIYAFNNSQSSGNVAGEWWTSGYTSTESYLPTGLVNGSTAIALTSSQNGYITVVNGVTFGFDNYRYFGKTAGSKAELLTAIGDPANWVGNNLAAEVFDFSLIGNFPDTTPPTISAVSSNITKASAKVNATSSEDAILYWVRTLSSTAPSKAQVMAQQDSTGAYVAAGGSSFVRGTVAFTADQNPLQSDTAYYVYTVAKDSSNNISNVSSTSFTTEPAILNFASTNTTSTEASFSWDAVSGATTLKLESSPAGLNNWSTLISSISTNATTVTATGLTPAASYDFRLAATGGANAGTSSKVSVTMKLDAATPSISTQPVGTTVNVGDVTPLLYVVATVSDTGALSYQWYSNSTNSSSGGTLIVDATSNPYAAPTTVAGVTYYYAEVKNTNNSVTGVKTAAATSSAAGVTVIAPAYTVSASAAALTPGVGVDNTITLTVKNALGNTDTTFEGPHNVTISGYVKAPDNSYGSFNGTALTASPNTISVIFANGVATANLALNKAAAQTIGLSVANVTTPATNTLGITPVVGSAAAMALTTDLTAPVSNGGAFAQQPIVTLGDAYGNTRTGDSSTVVTVSKKDTGTWTLTGTATATASSGVVTFTSLGATNAAEVTGAQLAFDADTGSLTPIASTTVTLPAPAPAQSVSASAAVLTPGVGAAAAITLTVKNALGNTDTTFSGAHHVTISGYAQAPDNSFGSFNGTVLTASPNTISVIFASGVATANLTLNKAAAQTISLNVAGVATPGTNTLGITPAAGSAAAMALTTNLTAPASNGGLFVQQPITVLRDVYGNTSVGDSSTVVTVSKKDAGNWTLTGTATATASSGVVTFTGLGATNAAEVTGAQLAFDVDGLAQMTSTTVTLPWPGAAAPRVESVAGGDGHVLLAWSEVYGSVSYAVYQRTASGTYGAAVATVSGAVYDVKGLTNGTTYSFVVKAMNPSGISPASNEVSATPQVPLPGAPVLQPAVAGNTQVSLTWNPVIGSTGYKIFISTTSGGYGSEATTVSGSVYGYTVTGLINGTTYYFVVKATNPGGDSAATNEVSATPVTVPSAPTDVTAEAGNGQAIVSFTVPVNGGSPITRYEVTASPGNITATGAASPITVTGLTNGTTYTFTVKAVNRAGSSAASTASNEVTPRSRSNSSSNSGGSSTSTPPAVPSTDGTASTSAQILVNGKAENAGTVTTTQVNEQTVTTVAIDSKKLEDQLDAEGQHAVITIPVNTKSDVVILELNGHMVKSMEQKQAVVEIKTENATYTLPAQQINISAVSDQLGKNVQLSDIKIQIEISKPTPDAVKTAENLAAKGEFTIVAPPLNFTVKASYGDTTIEVSKFNAYVERTIAIPDGVNPSQITTGVVIEPDGTVRHVPTRIVMMDGKYVAKVNSLTNSTYSIVWHPVAFKDVAQHWAKDTVNDLGSRMVISGSGNDQFSPDREITRAEFATIIVRGLGLKMEHGTMPFSDVKTSDWYSSAINTAYSYQLISGFEDGTFRPSANITREQAMVMIAKAMTITNLKAKLPSLSTDAILRPYSDTADASSWAISSIADSIQAGVVSGRNSTGLDPKAYITRAEVATIIQRLLQKSELI